MSCFVNAFCLLRPSETPPLRTLYIHQGRSFRSQDSGVAFSSGEVQLLYASSSSMRKSLFTRPTSDPRSTQRQSIQWVRSKSLTRVCTACGLERSPPSPMSQTSEGLSVADCHLICEPALAGESWSSLARGEAVAVHQADVDLHGPGLNGGGVGS
jgi:hypothetical protein